MKEVTVYGLKCDQEDEPEILSAVNLSLSKLKRKMATETKRAMLDGRKPFALSH